MSSATTNHPQPYALEEHVVVQDNVIPQHTRFTLELDMIYDPVESDNDHGMEHYASPVPLILHPLGHLSSSSALPPQISHVTWTMARRASQSSKMQTAIPSPSGVWLDIAVLEPLLESFLDALVQSWMDRRLWLTPIHGSVWDTYDFPAIEGQDQLHHHQLFLPTNGAAWSADALQQFFTAALPSTYSSFFGISALQWSRWLVEGTTPQAQLYWRWDHHHALLGMQLDLPQSVVDIKGPDVASIVLSWMEPKPTYPLTTSKTIHREQGSQDNSPTMNLEQVVRRPRPNHGRLETWWEAQDVENALDGCSLRFRQRLPPYMMPVWHSLQVDVVDHDDGEGISPPEDRIVVGRHVEWDKKYGSSVLSVSLSAIPASAVLALDYQPAYLSLDDFPGDPNRGREIPPMVATLHCPSTSDFTFPSMFVSNSVLILPPVPDMSMPFNVLSLTCSLYAYLVGTLVTLLIKRASERVRYTLEPHKKPKSKLAQIKERIQQTFLRKGKVLDKEEGKVKQTGDGGSQTSPEKEDPVVSDEISNVVENEST
eukprot:Nitzschia sp. Nitz4//scaffold99_size76975//48689//50308//NITZ4_005579-RA/size76975-processed-gene-0.49-mRNA-1//-1//CDS//3329560859//1040//frame0